MKYYFNIQFVDIPFEEVIDQVISGLKDEGFGIISDIDISDTLKKKINVDFKKYRILGACNPALAYNAIQNEDKIGLMLPCNVLVEENNEGGVEASIIDPVASMMAIENNNLGDIAKQVRSKLQKVAENLSQQNVNV